MVLVAGVDTIVGLVGEPPPEIEVDCKTMTTQQLLLQQWNGYFIAILPYCFKCKVPLAWHFAPREEGYEDEIFTCPDCGRVWVQDKEWKEKVGKK